ncbi:carbonic anhydrase [Psychromonas sp. Urea-02u-13]|uniref:carbonic anhydrase n=1 Tax=Psychromonas sp. Urea-02u-13 TaxID=2058326 RepID=UPI000C339E56|nr:carbonic anhydrase [Psychromonas sp. Urea-02u-13]PKG38495.1 carbonic anhydrase [Psychromonas sp. Urea-02u-13]
MSATDKLIAGYQRFREGYYEQNKDQLSKLAKEGQFPKIAIISCSDSRVDPGVILDCEPGDLFVIRNVANLVPPKEDNDSLHGTSAALEFAVTGLEVESIIVLGHTQCGGIKALMDTPATEAPDTFIGKWMQQLEGVRNDILEDESLTTKISRYNCCERKGIQQSLQNLMTFPWVKERVEAGTLKLHGWRYDLSSSELCAMDKKSGKLTRIS